MRFGMKNASLYPPDLEEAREAVSRIVQDVTRASEIISRIGVLFKKGEPAREWVDVNEVIREMISLLRSEAGRHATSIHTELAPELPNVRADRVQRQQVKWYGSYQRGECGRGPHDQVATESRRPGVDLCQRYRHRIASRAGGQGF